MKYFSVLCIFVILALAVCHAAVAEQEAVPESAVTEKKTEKRGIYGFGYGGYGGHGGYGGYYGGGHGGYYGGHGHGFGYPSYGYASVHHAVPYYGHGGYYPYHGHGFYH